VIGQLEHASSVPAGLRGRLRLVIVEARCERLAGIPGRPRLAPQGYAVVIDHLSIEETA
jgi:hypothetical protein